MATLDTIYDFQSPVEAATYDILKYYGLTNIWTSRTTGSKDTVPYTAVEAGNFSPTPHVHLSGSYFFNDIFNGQLEVTVITERTLTPTSHSVNTAKVTNVLMQNNLYNTQSAMPNHYMIRSTLAGIQNNVVEDRVLDETRITFNLVVAVRPEVWP